MPKQDPEPNQRMAVPSGTQLGRYEIRSILGSGGMGQVYLAQDLQLRRLVALKLLPPEFTRDEDRIRRFKQEAFAASALNHPNIFTIFEIGQKDEIHFIATEYIEGLSLRQIISKESVGIEQALDWGTQIASALAAAHAAGIIHRDIKPDNIMVRRDGFVKVLDFGLAKLGEYTSRTSDPEAATLQVVQTDPGKIMGTANYMSPEQTRGLQLDERTDIWSLGVILYELVTGRLPFHGLSASDVVASILTTEPVPLQRFSANVPPELQRIVRKALQKDPDERYHLAKEIAIDLKNLRRDLEFSAEVERSVQPMSGNRSSELLNQSGMGVTATGPIDRPRSTATETPTPKENRRFGIVAKMLAAILALALVIGAVVFINHWIGAKRREESAANMRVIRVTTTGAADKAAISPDGKYVVHVAAQNGQQSLRVRQVNTTSDVELVAPSDIKYEKLIFSSDGDFVYYVAADRNSVTANLYSIDRLGGTRRKLISNVTRGVTLSPDGQKIAFIRNIADIGEDVVLVADVTGGNERRIAARKLPNFFTSVSWSPKNNSLVCAAGSFVPTYNNYLVEISLNDSKEKQLGNQTWRSMGEIEWVPDSTGLIVTGSDQDSFVDHQQLWYLSYPEGQVRRVTKDLNHYQGISITSDSTKLVTLQSTTTCNLWLVTNADSNQPRQITTGSRLDGREGLAYTTDGEVVYSSNVSGNMDLWVMNADGSNQRQLTADAGNNSRPVVTRDRRYIIFESDRSGTSNIWRIDADGTNPRQLTSGSGEANPHYTPDGKWVVYSLLGAGKPTVWRVSIDGGAPQHIIDRYTTNPAVSPDGKSIACFYRDEQSNARTKIAVFNADGGEPIRTFELAEAPLFDSASSGLRWSPDGKALIYAVTNGNVSNLFSQPISDGPAKQVTNFRSDRIFSFDWAADGKQLMLSRGVVTSDVVLISDFR
jgi:serine/threonine protein kinase/Tol biopolymer transport system component